MENLCEHALSWLETPYKKDCAIKGVGADCVGFIESCLLEIGITPPNRELGVFAALDIIATEVASPNSGDILVFKADPFHLAIYGYCKIIHAHHTQGIVQNTYGNWFKSRLLRIYRLKEI